MTVTSLILSLTLSAAWAAEPAAHQSPAKVTVNQAVLCTAIADREPADPRESGAEYEAQIDRVYFWNAAKVAEAPQTVKHVWSRDGKALSEVVLELKHSRTRTWSSKQVFPGQWKVQVVSSEGEVLASADFTVK